MKRILISTWLLASAASIAGAQTATQTTFQVDAVNQIAFAGGPSLVANTATAAAGVVSSTTRTVTYTITGGT